MEFVLFTIALRPVLGSHTDSYPIGTGGKAPGVWSWPLTSI